MAALLEVVPSDDALSALHVLPADGVLPETPPLFYKLARSHVDAGHKLPKRWRRQIAARDRTKVIRKLYAQPEWLVFLAAFEEFVSRVIIPMCSPSGEEVMVQHPPTLRIIMPGRKPSITMHVDSVRTYVLTFKDSRSERHWC